METGQRGYLLTGDQSYLQPYAAAQGRIGTDFASLRVQLASRTENQRSLESQLESLAKSKQVEMERTIKLRQLGYRHRSFVLVNTNEGEGYMDEVRRIAASLESAERSNFTRLDNEKYAALSKMFSRTIIASAGPLLLAACLFGLFRYHEQRLTEESAYRREQLAVRDSQLVKLTSALSGQARSGITALNTNSRLLLEKYGGFLPRQGHECAEQMKEVATEMERLRQDLVGDQIPATDATAAA